VSDRSFDSPEFNWSLLRPVLLLVPVAIVGSAIGSLVLSLGIVVLSVGRTSIEDAASGVCFLGPASFVAGVVGALAGTLVFGLPTMLVLRWGGKESVWTYALAGLIGTILLSILGPAVPFLGLLLLPYCLATAIAFWRIVRAPALREQADGGAPLAAPAAPP
jgi:hypothetical protein